MDTVMSLIEEKTLPLLERQCACGLNYLTSHPALEPRCSFCAEQPLHPYPYRVGVPDRTGVPSRPALAGREYTVILSPAGKEESEGPTPNPRRVCYLAHREQNAAYRRKYYLVHRERFAAYHHAYYLAHREQVAAYQHAYYLAHRK